MNNFFMFLKNQLSMPLWKSFHCYQALTEYSQVSSLYLVQSTEKPKTFPLRTESARLTVTTRGEPVNNFLSSQFSSTLHAVTLADSKKNYFSVNNETSLISTLRSMCQALSRTQCLVVTINKTFKHLKENRSDDEDDFLLLQRQVSPYLQERNNNWLPAKGDAWAHF